MSELKAFDIVVAEEGNGEGFVKYRRAVYDKAEVDKVISELKAENDHLRSTTHSERDEYIDMVNARDKEIAGLKARIVELESERETPKGEWV